MNERSTPEPKDPSQISGWVNIPAGRDTPRDTPRPLDDESKRLLAEMRQVALGDTENTGDEPQGLREQ